MSVVVPAFQARRFVVDAVRSALTQHDAPDVEVIVVDDGSTDGTADAVTALGDPRVRVLTQEHAGPSAARNRAIADARGDLVAFLDADDRWLPHKLAQQVAYLSRHTELGTVGGLLRYIAPDGRVLGVAAQERGRLDRARVAAGEQMPFLLSATLVRADVLAAAGRFDEQLERSEDLDLLARLAHHAPIGMVDEVVAEYRIHASSATFSEFTVQRNAVRYIQGRLRGDDVTWPTFKRTYRRTAGEYRQDAVAHHYRLTGLAVAERRWARAAVHAAVPLLLAPRATLRRARTQQVLRA